MAKSRDLFDMVFGTILLSGGLTTAIGALFAIVWNSFLTILNIPYIGLLFTMGIGISFVVLIASLIMIYYGAKMVNRGAGAFKGIIFGTAGAICLVLAVISFAISAGVATIVSILLLLFAAIFMDLAIGGKLFVKNMLAILPKIPRI